MPALCRYAEAGENIGNKRWQKQEEFAVRIPKTDSVGSPLAKYANNQNNDKNKNKDMRDPSNWEIEGGPDYFTFKAYGCKKPRENGSGFEPFRLSDDGKSFIGYPSRVSNLKLGLGSLLADGQNLSDSTKMGIGYYENLSRGGNSIDRQGAIIKAPVLPLTDDHRLRLLKVLKDIRADGTIPKKYPDPNPYPDPRPPVWQIGALPSWAVGRDVIYVRTSDGNRDLPITGIETSSQWRNFHPGSRRTLYRDHFGFYNQILNAGLTRNRTGNNVCISVGRVRGCVDFATAILGISTPMTNAFAESGAYMMGTTTSPDSIDVSGFNQSSNSTKTGNHYNSPIDRDSQCDGYGIYFLTDGAPDNHTSESAEMMAKTLNRTQISIAGIEYSASNPNGMRPVNNPISQPHHDGPSWLYMGAYAKALREQNPTGKEIRTATVGFGQRFEALKVTIPYKGREILDCSALDSMIAQSSNAQSNPVSGSIVELERRLSVLRERKRNLERSLHTLGILRPGGSPIAPIGQTLAQGFSYTFRTKYNRIVKQISEIERELDRRRQEQEGSESNEAVTNNTTENSGVYDREKLIHAKNLCLLGSQAYDYGRGGFTATSDPEALLQSIKNFVDELNVVVPAAPSGTISVPKDPLSVTNILPYAYLPMVQAEPASTLATWKGNLKKYHTLNGTLYGQNSVKLYKTHPNATAENRDFPFATNWTAKDLWQTEAIAVNDEGVAKPTIDVGGTYEHIKAPVAGNVNNTRKLYLQSGNSLVEVGVRDNRLFGFERLDDSYTPKHIAYLMNFLGFAVPVEDIATDAIRADVIDAYNNVLAEIGDEIYSNKVLGGVVHSVPVLATYEGEFEDGNITNDPAKRKDYLLYGSMDGALHMVNATSGGETFNFIPKAMFADGQIEALVYDSKRGRQGNPAFGVDAPWNVRANYGDNALTSGRITASKMYAYGGLRMGGVGFYGLNISDKDRPGLLFAIDNAKQGFDRLGQTWSRPLTATIKLSHNQTKDVVIFGGGYDMCYENPLFKLGDGNNSDVNCQNKSMAQGNAVYMIDAETGALLKTWTASNINDGSEHMKHSIVGEIAGIDRNNNGYIDHLYFGDLGGQIFRIDLQEGSGTTADTINTKVTRIFDANAGVDTPNHIPYRFYDQPAVSVYKNEQAGAANSRFALINIASGDRSNPLSKRRSLDDANRIYGIIDDDVASANLFKSNYVAVSKDISNSDLLRHDPKALEDAKISNNKTVALNAQTALKNRNQKGWYYDLNRFNAVIGVPYLKSVGSGVADGNVYYSSVYSPEYNYKQGASCEATIAGGTERQLYCLPWGVCAKPDGTIIGQSKNGTLGFIKGGPGIQELTIGTLTSREGVPSRFRTLIGHEPINGMSTNGLGVNPIASGGGLAGSDGGSSLKTGVGTGASKEGERVITAERFVVDIKRWYDLQISENN